MWWSGDSHVTGSDFAKPVSAFAPVLTVFIDELCTHSIKYLQHGSEECQAVASDRGAVQGLSLGFHSPRPGHNLLLVFCPEEEYTFNTLRWPRDGELCIVRMFTCLLFHHATASIRANLQKNTPNSQIADLGLQARGRRFPPEIR